MIVTPAVTNEPAGKTRNVLQKETELWAGTSIGTG